MEIKKVETLEDCIKQIDKCKFECEAGSLDKNTGYIKLKELVKKLTIPVVSINEVECCYIETHNRYTCTYGFAYCPDCGEELW